jgi:hypothetical protein
VYLALFVWTADGVVELFKQLLLLSAVLIKGLNSIYFKAQAKLFNAQSIIINKQTAVYFPNKQTNKPFQKQ